jgi:hypothetical protein
MSAARLHTYGLRVFRFDPRGRPLEFIDATGASVGFEFDAGKMGKFLEAPKAWIR